MRVRGGEKMTTSPTVMAGDCEHWANCSSVQQLAEDRISLEILRKQLQASWVGDVWTLVVGVEKPNRDFERPRAGDTQRYGLVPQDHVGRCRCKGGLQ